MNNRPLFSRRSFYRRAAAWVLLATAASVPIIVLFDSQLQTRWRLVSGLFPSLNPNIQTPAIAAAAAYAAALIVVMLLWWRIRELRTLRQIFEVPWRGLAEDVENVGILESVVRAVTTTTLMLFCGGIVFLTIGKPIHMRGKDGNNLGSPTGEAASNPGAPKAPASDRAARSTGESPPSRVGTPPPSGSTPADAEALIEEMKRLNSGIASIANAMGPIGDALPNADFVEADTRYLAALYGIRDALSKSTDHAEVVAVLKTIRELVDKLNRPISGPPGSVVPPDSMAGCSRLSSSLAHEPVLSGRTAYRRIDHELFFDARSDQLSKVAQHRLSSILTSLRPGAVLTASGEADKGSDGEGATTLPERRTKAVSDFVAQHGLSVVSIPSRNLSGVNASEPYRRIVRFTIWQPC